MLTQTTRATKFGCRVRYLKCSTCSYTGTERIDGPSRPRPKKSSRLEPTLPSKGNSAVGMKEIIGILKASRHHAAAGVRIDSRDATARSMKGNAMLNIFSLAKKLDTDWHVVYDFAVDGDVPPPVYIGSLARWREAEVEAWIVAGCPVGTGLDDAGYTQLQDTLLSELQELEQKGSKL